MILLVGCVLERFPLLSDLITPGWATSYTISNGSELAGKMHLLILRVGRGVSEAVMIAHAQGPELSHEVLVSRT